MRASRATSKELRKNGTPVPPPPEAFHDKDLNGASVELHELLAALQAMLDRHHALRMRLVRPAMVPTRWRNHSARSLPG